VAAIFGLIAFDDSPLGVDILVYAAVAMTVFSGADYFLGLRRHMEDAEAEAAAAARAHPSSPAPEVVDPAA
jgi:hypothetical protein